MKTGTGTLTALAGSSIDYNGTTTIEDGAYILNGTHTTNTVDGTVTILTPSRYAVYIQPPARSAAADNRQGVNLGGKIAPETSNGWHVHSRRPHLHRRHS